MNVEKIKADIIKFNNERNWNQFHSVKNLSMALSVECSELVEIMQWMSEEESNKISLNPELKLKAQDEVADIFLYLMQVSMKLNIDLESAVFSKMQKNGIKHPVKLEPTTK